MKATKALLTEAAEALELCKARIGRMHDLDGAHDPENSMRHCADAIMLAGNVETMLRDISQRFSVALWKREQKARASA